MCQCGNRGCFEATSSGDAVVERYARLIESGVPTTLAPGDTDFPAICDAFRRGEKAAQVVIHELTTNLAKALASAISMSGATVTCWGAWPPRRKTPPGRSPDHAPAARHPCAFAADPGALCVERSACWCVGCGPARPGQTRVVRWPSPRHGHAAHARAGGALGRRRAQDFRTSQIVFVLDAVPRHPGAPPLRPTLAP